MPCNLTKGRNITCRESVGGIKFVYFAQHSELTSTAVSSGELTDFDLGSGDDIYRYKLPRGTGSVTETITGSVENGTIFYAQSLNIKLHRLTKEDQNQIKLLAANRLLVFVQMNELVEGTTHDKILCLGRVNGLLLNAGTNVTGAAFGDMNGYDWTFDGQEVAPMPMVADYTTTPLDNAAFTYNSIVTS